jgi:hypothetical protein
MLVKLNGFNGQVSAPSTISGRNLAHAPRSKIERAFVAADLHRGRLRLERLTILQCAALAKVCPPYIQLALKANPDQRELILCGQLPLTAEGLDSSLAQAWHRASSAQRANFIRTIGPDRVWATIETVI